MSDFTQIVELAGAQATEGQALATTFPPENRKDRREGARRQVRLVLRASWPTHSQVLLAVAYRSDQQQREATASRRDHTNLP